VEIGGATNRMKVLGEGWDEADFHQRFAPIIDEMIAQRGWVINSYAQVEFLFADLIVKLRKFPECDDGKPVAFGIDGRVRRLRQLCEIKPLASHAGNILPLLDRMLELEKTRHFFTHGFLSVHIQQDGKRMGMHMRRYVPPEKGQRETKEELFVLPEQMAEAREKWRLFAQTALIMFQAIYDELGLERHDVTDGNPPLLEA
jgi:hypothetical protein